jgi:hypothetical protein
VPANLLFGTATAERDSNKAKMLALVPIFIVCSTTVQIPSQYKAG